MMNDRFVTEDLIWRKSSRCEGGHCVEVAVTGDTVHVRNSQRTGSVVTFSKAEFAVFMQAVTAGEFSAAAI